MKPHLSTLSFQLRCYKLLFMLSTVFFSCHTAPFGIPLSIQLKAFRNLLGQRLEQSNRIQDEGTMEHRKPLIRFKVTSTNRELTRQDKVNMVATNVKNLIQVFKICTDTQTTYPYKKLLINVFLMLHCGRWGGGVVLSKKLFSIINVIFWYSWLWYIKYFWSCCWKKTQKTNFCDGGSAMTA